MSADVQIEIKDCGDHHRLEDKKRTLWMSASKDEYCPQLQLIDMVQGTMRSMGLCENHEGKRLRGG